MPVKVFILIEAGEGNTDTVIVASSKEALFTAVFEHYAKNSRESVIEEDKMFFAVGGTALIKMLENHTTWDYGRYILANVEPHWQEWTLVIAGQ